MKLFVISLLASLGAGLMMPLAFMLAEAASQGEPVVIEDFNFGYTIVAPFALLTALAVAWPAYRLQRDDRPVARRVLVAMAAGFVVPTALLLPFVDEFPWKGGAVGAATALLWAGLFELGRTLIHNPSSIRSEPSG